MYGEGGLDDFSKAAFEQAVTDDTLISVEALSGGFSENPDQADISYSESYSLVNFLIETYGKDQMLALLKALQEGATVDGALQTVYGFDINGLEDAWREDIGAQERQATLTDGSATPTSTPVPTIVPVSGSVVESTTTPTRGAVTLETATPTKTSSPLPATAPPSATSRPPPTITKANPAKPTPAMPTRVSKPSPTTTQEPEKSSPSWLSGVVRVFTSGCVACLILGGVAIVFFFAVLRPRRRRRKP